MKRYATDKPIPQAQEESVWGGRFSSMERSSAIWKIIRCAREVRTFICFSEASYKVRKAAYAASIRKIKPANGFTFAGSNQLGYP